MVGQGRGLGDAGHLAATCAAGAGRSQQAPTEGVGGRGEVATSRRWAQPHGGYAETGVAELGQHCSSTPSRLARGMGRLGWDGGPVGGGVGDWGGELGFFGKILLGVLSAGPMLG
jgi:hypothetical protein